MNDNRVKVMPFTGKRRKEWKKTAKQVVKTHYVLLVMIALLGGLLGVEGLYLTNQGDLTSAQQIQIIDKTKAIEVTGQKAVSIIEKGQTATSDSRYDNVLEKIMEGNFRAGKKISQKEINDLQNDTKGSKAIAGRSSGILAGLVNDVSSGMLMVRIGTGIQTIVKNGKLAGAIVILIVLGIYFAVWYFLINTYKVTMYRTYLEASVYKKVPIGHVLFIKSVGKWKNVAGAMFRCWLYHVLWSLTIIGGIIKHYSYWCVPFILAENPGMSGKEAIALSRKMMNGRKWETFKFELTFIGWEILSALTFGVLKVFFVAPYERAAEAQLFTYIRYESIIAKIEGTEKLKDQFLYEKTDKEVLSIKYGDILYREVLAKNAEVKLKGARRFFVENFGLWIGSKEEQLRYEEVEVEQVNLRRAREAAESLAYPERYNPYWNAVAEEEAASKNNYLKNYSIWTIICLFALFAFIGWGWEVALHLIKDGVFVNRGAMHGPWLPIYGTGGALIVLILKRLRNNPALLGVSAMVLCGIVEFFTSYFMEMGSGIRYWDYTGYFLNINGRICMEGLTVFAVGGMAAVYVIAPALDRKLQKLNSKIIIAFCIAYMLCFAVDAVYSSYYPNVGKGITDYDNYKNVSSIELGYYSCNSDSGSTDCCS